MGTSLAFPPTFHGATSTHRQCQESYRLGVGYAVCKKQQDKPDIAGDGHGKQNIGDAHNLAFIASFNTSLKVVPMSAEALSLHDSSDVGYSA